MNLRLNFGVPIVLAALVATLAACGNTNAPGSDAAGGATTGGQVRVDASSMPPWPAPTDDVPARVAAAGLDLGPMGTAEHYHPHLEIVIDGVQVEVPANIGVDPATGAMSAVHTHEADGTIHIEADREGEAFTLGQLFTEWGVSLSKTRIGGVAAEAGKGLDVTSDGRSVDGDPRDLRLEPEQMIVLRLP